MYEIAAQLQKSVSKGAAKPKYDAGQKARHSIIKCYNNGAEGRLEAPYKL